MLFRSRRRARRRCMTTCECVRSSTPSPMVSSRRCVAGARCAADCCVDSCRVCAVWSVPYICLCTRRRRLIRWSTHLIADVDDSLEAPMRGPAETRETREPPRGLGPDADGAPRPPCRRTTQWPVAVPCRVRTAGLPVGSGRAYTTPCPTSPSVRGDRGGK